METNEVYSIGAMARGLVWQLARAVQLHCKDGELDCYVSNQD